MCRRDRKQEAACDADEALGNKVPSLGTQRSAIRSELLPLPLPRDLGDPSYIAAEMKV